MRYEFVGRKTEFVGKTLWEIVGNLKNFGVGRLVKESHKFSNPMRSFFRIIKVQPIPPPENEFDNRSVMVWADEVVEGHKTGIKLLNKTDIAKFQLIPKLEEEKYLKAVEIEPPPEHVTKYISWPPLYKKLWEKKNLGAQAPKIERLIEKLDGYSYIIKDEEMEQSKSSLYKGKLSLHEMYLEIVRLKMLIKKHEEAKK